MENTGHRKLCWNELNPNYLSLKCGKCCLSLFLSIEGNKTISSRPSRIIKKYDLSRNYIPIISIEEFFKIFSPRLKWQICNKQVVYWQSLASWRVSRSVLLWFRFSPIKLQHSTLIFLQICISRGVILYFIYTNMQLDRIVPMQYAYICFEIVKSFQSFLR